MAELPTSLIVSARNLLRDITKYYGDEQGMKMWRSLKEGMGEDLQNAVLMGLLRGIKYDLKIRTHASKEYRMFINAIKAVRHATGYGLKDAKDFMVHGVNIWMLPEGVKE
jgi:hypothetical protein